jgi:hypothetical protein
MARKMQTYRGARRNRAKRDGIKFPWNVADVTRISTPSWRENKRDREVAKAVAHISAGPQSLFSMIMRAVAAQGAHGRR